MGHNNTPYLLINFLKTLNIGDSPRKKETSMRKGYHVALSLKEN